MATHRTHTHTCTRTHTFSRTILSHTLYTPLLRTIAYTPFTHLPSTYICCTRRSFTISFLFPVHFPSNLYLSFAAYWKKLTCGVIRSFNFWFPGSMLSCFSAFCFLLFLLCLSASLLYLLFFSASLLYLLLCFCDLPVSFLFCFSAFPSSLLFCFCASVPFYFYCSTFSFLRSCVFAALLPAPLLLCFLSLLPLSFFLLLYFLLFVNTLGETQRNLKENLIKTPDKKPYTKT